MTSVVMMAHVEQLNTIKTQGAATVRPMQVNFGAHKMSSELQVGCTPSWRRSS
jgi:hypothetical protein